MKRSWREANAPSTASACPSRLPSPQPTAPSCVSTRTNNQRGGTRNVSILAIRLIRVSPEIAELGYRHAKECLQEPRSSAQNRRRPISDPSPADFVDLVRHPAPGCEI